MSNTFVKNFKNLTKKIAIISLIGFSCGCAKAQNTINYKPLTKEITDFPAYNCINMANGLEAPHEGEWGYKFSKEDIVTIKQKGFDTIRIPINWAAHTSNDRGNQIDPVFLARIDEILGWALENHLNVILDFHFYEDLMVNPPKEIPKFYNIWNQIAYHYRDTPNNVIFEIINEPSQKFTGDLSNYVQINAYKIIRRYNPDRYVIFGGDNWSNIASLDKLKFPQDKKVVATVHYYDPFEFTHQGATWIPNPPPKGRSWPKDGEVQDLQNNIARIYNWRQASNIPVIVGEYGVFAEVPLHLRADWYNQTTRELNSAQIPHCVFNFTAGFDVYNRENKEWIKPIADSLGLETHHNQ